MRKWFTLAAAAAALGAALVVIVDYGEDTEESSEALEAYMEAGGIERETLSEEEMVSLDPLDGVGSEPGMQAPDFSLPTLHEDQLSLADLEGDYVVLNIWATWCPPCRDEMPDFAAFYEDYKDDGVHVLGLNRTATEPGIDAVRQFAEDFSIPFPVIIDEEDVVEDLYSVYVMPTTYIITPDGRVAMNRPGYISYDVLEEQYLSIREQYEDEA
ncbi:TlpA disulfide reductase family protein [Bacillus daqingensis]|uniref:TlpA disulfide reductase family protein n=1 Tax=Bacillus daqingensis TaxID=872396 RepID=A0ABV9NZC4_9BACI